MDLRSFRAGWLRLSFFGANGEPIQVRDLYQNLVAKSVDLHGPWTEDASEAWHLRKMFGVDVNTLTALFELPNDSDGVAQISGKPLISGVQVEYDNELSRRQDPLANPVDYIELDYLSSSDNL